jgi:type I restriction enzyme, S subunit
MIAKVEAAIERLQEYRTALITAAMTGRIDVRRAMNGD